MHLLTCRFVCEGEEFQKDEAVPPEGGAAGPTCLNESAAQMSAKFMKAEIQCEPRFIDDTEPAPHSKAANYCYNPNEENHSLQKKGETDLAYERRKGGRWMQMWLSLLAHGVKPSGGVVIQMFQMDAGLSHMQVRAA